MTRKTISQIKVNAGTDTVTLMIFMLRLTRSGKITQYDTSIEGNQDRLKKVKVRAFSARFGQQRQRNANDFPIRWQHNKHDWQRKNKVRYRERENRKKPARKKR